MDLKLLKSSLKKIASSSTGRKLSFGLLCDSHVLFQVYILSIRFLFSSVFNYFLSQSKAEPAVFHLTESAIAHIFSLLAYVFFF